MPFPTEPFQFKELVDYQAGSVVSQTLLKNDAGNLTLFAFATGEGLSEHTAPFDALVQILEGSAEITLGGQQHTVMAGQSLLMPARVPHALKANEDFKMLLTMIKA